MLFLTHRMFFLFNKGLGLLSFYDPFTVKKCHQPFCVSRVRASGESARPGADKNKQGEAATFGYHSTVWPCSTGRSTYMQISRFPHMASVTYVMSTHPSIRMKNLIFSLLEASALKPTGEFGALAHHP